MKVTNKIDWNEEALWEAAEAHENHFSSRRGVWHLEDVDKLCVYNNNPYAQAPEKRDEETATFRAWLKSQGIKELAYATYPEDGYTYAMIIDCGEERETEVVKELERILVDNWTK